MLHDTRRLYYRLRFCAEVLLVCPSADGKAWKGGASSRLALQCEDDHKKRSGQDISSYHAHDGGSKMEGVGNVYGGETFWLGKVEVSHGPSW